MFEQTFKNNDDVLWKEVGCSSELDYKVWELSQMHKEFAGKLPAGLVERGQKEAGA